MKKSYKHMYYDHYSMVKSPLPPKFQPDCNYMMRFNSPMQSYSYKNNEFTIIFFKKGDGQLIWNNKSSKIKSNQFIVTNPSIGWDYVNPNRSYIDVLSFVISKKLMASLVLSKFTNVEALLNNPFQKDNNSLHFFEYSLNSNYYLSGKLLNKIYNLSNSENFKYYSAEELSISLISSLCHDQNRAYNLMGKINARRTSTQKEVFKRLLITREYIHDNINRNISLDELSSVSCLSKFHLFESFKSIYKKTPHQYINHQRIIKAKEIIDTSDLLITDISSMLGFTDVPSFSKLFKKKYGVAPTKYKTTS